MFKFNNRQERDSFLMKLSVSTFFLWWLSWCWINLETSILLLIISLVLFVINEPMISGLETDEEKTLRRESFLEGNVLWIDDETFTKDDVSKILSDSYWQEKITSDRKKQDSFQIKLLLFYFYGSALLLSIYAYFNHSSLC